VALLVYERTVRGDDEVLGKREERTPASVINGDHDPEIAIYSAVPDGLRLNLIHDC
jgi:hypothetical protein